MTAADRLVLEEAAKGGQGAARTHVPLPANRPGRLRGGSDAGSDEERVAEAEGEDRGPIVSSIASLRLLALEESGKVLPNEVAMMLPAGPARDEVVAMCSAAPGCSPNELSQLLAEQLVDLLWRPLLGCEPRLLGVAEQDVRSKLQLFWRCAVALCVMPVAQLAVLSSRKRHFCTQELLDEVLPSADAAAPATRLAHIRINLPVFAMVAQFPPGAAEAAPQKRAEAAPPSESQNTMDSKVETNDASEETIRNDAGDPEIARDSPFEEKAMSAAKHTYDVGYAKWDKFDVEAELRSMDKPAPAKQVVTVPERKTKELDFDDPLQALEKAIEESKQPVATMESVENTVEESEAHAPPATAATPPATSQGPTRPSLDAQYKRWESFDPDEEEEEGTSKPPKLVEATTHPPPPKSAARAGPAVKKGFFNRPKPAQEQPLRKETAVDAPQVEEPHNLKVVDDSTASGRSTAASLNKDYQKWDRFKDGGDSDTDGDAGELEELEDDDNVLGPMATDLGLDEITGPADEVAQIKRHWLREAKKSQRQARKDGRKEARDAVATARARREPELEQGPVISRPCEYRPAEAGTKAISKDYQKWKSFDADAALLELDNEGTTEDGNAMRCSSNSGSAMIQCEGYTKDREEYDLDQELESHVGGMKKMIAQRTKDANGFKAEGNAFLREGKPQKACDAYKKGLETMQLCEQASVLMADSLAHKNQQLLNDLRKNLAAAQLQVGDFAGARDMCNVVLEKEKRDEKALYRRAVAHAKLGDVEDAKRDADRLAKARGGEDAVVMKLRTEIEASSELD